MEKQEEDTGKSPSLDEGWIRLNEKSQ